MSGESKCGITSLPIFPLIVLFFMDAINSESSIGDNLISSMVSFSFFQVSSNVTHDPVGSQLCISTMLKSRIKEMSNLGRGITIRLI
jgi:hypothetical protein